MVCQGLGVLGTIIWSMVLAQELPHWVLCNFVWREMDSPQMPADTKLVENTALYPKGESFGN